MKTQTFPGDRRAFDPDSFVGCNGRFFRPVSVTYSAEVDKTTVSYEPVPMDEMSARYGHLIDAAEEKAALIELFGGHW